MNALLSVVLLLINVYSLLVLIHVGIELLVRFGVTSYANTTVAQVRGFTSQLVEPVLGRIRRFIPSFNGIDLSPFVLLVALYFLKVLISVDILGG